MDIEPIKITWSDTETTHEKTAHTAGQLIHIINWIEFNLKSQYNLGDCETLSISDTTDNIYLSSPDGKMHVGTLSKANKAGE